MTVVTHAVIVHLRYKSRFVKDPPTLGSDQQVHTLDLKLEVNDEAIRQQHPYDGFERPFVMVPRESKDKLTWERHELQFRETAAGEWGTTRDRYEASPDVELDLSAVKKHGVALGMDTNKGQVWLQPPGQNYQVKGDWF